MFRKYCLIAVAAIALLTNLNYALAGGFDTLKLQVARWDYGHPVPYNPYDRFHQRLHAGMSVPNATQADISNGLAGGGDTNYLLEGAMTIGIPTHSPAWVDFNFNIPQNTNAIGMTLDFVSNPAAEGYMVFYLDSTPLFFADERYFPSEPVQLVLSFDQAISAGMHEFSFRLDPYTADQSILEISNIHYGTIPEPATMLLLGVGALAAGRLKRA